MKKMFFLQGRLRELAARSVKMVEFSGGASFDALEDLAAHLRAAQLYAHNAHNLTRGESFFADHAFLGELYEAYTEAYDDIVELLIGEGAVPDLQDFQSRAVTALRGMSDDYFPELLAVETRLQGIVEAVAGGGADQGVLQIVGSLAQESKGRVYKLRQRIQEDEQENLEGEDEEDEA